jgi:hypothetical protein
MCEEYNGWKNYATWATNVHDLFTDRDDLADRAYEAYAESLTGDSTFNLGRDEDGREYFARSGAQRKVADAMREELEEAAENNFGAQNSSWQESFWQDLIAWAIESVDFWRLAEVYADDAQMAYRVRSKELAR